jgi:hypothetical protein
MRQPKNTPTVLRAAWVLALAALLAHAAHTGLGVGRPDLNALFDDWIYNALMIGAAGAVLLRGIVGPTDRAAWLVLGAAAMAWSGGDLYYSLVLADHPEPPLPSVSDALFLAFYPAAYVGLALLVRRNVAAFQASLWLDALLGALAVSAVATALMYDAVRIGIVGDTAAVMTTVAYPIGDVLLIALVVAVFALTAWRPGATWGLIGTALALGAMGDGLYLYQSANGTYTEGSIIDSIWPASMLLLAAAGVAADEGPQRPARGHADPRDARAVRLRRDRRLRRRSDLRAEPARARPGLRDHHRPRPAPGGHAPREPADGGREPRRGDDGRADGDGQPAQARRRPRAALHRGAAGGPADPHPVRPRRLQALQRQLRPPRGRRAARPPRREAAPCVEPCGEAYRLGGDEFCALVHVGPDEVEPILAAAATALRDSGEGFEVESSYGAVAIPQEADSPSLALQTADQRMYARKDGRTSPVGMQTRDVLVAALHARQPDKREEADGVADLAAAVGHRLGSRARRSTRSRARGAARRRQGGRPRRDPRQGRPADRRRVVVHAPPSRARRAHPQRCPRHAPGGAARALHARALRRHRLPGRPEGRGDPARAPASSPCATPTSR